MRRARTQGRDARDMIGEGGEEGRSARNSRRVVINAMWKTGETWAEGEKSYQVDKKVLVQQTTTQKI